MQIDDPVQGDLVVLGSNDRRQSECKHHAWHRTT